MDFGYIIVPVKLRDIYLFIYLVLFYFLFM